MSLNLQKGFEKFHGPKGRRKSRREREREGGEGGEARSLPYGKRRRPDEGIRDLSHLSKGKKGGDPYFFTPERGGAV